MKISKTGIARVALVTTVAAVGGATAQTPVKQVVTGPTAEYWLSAETISGMAGMMGGGKPSPQAMMSMMMQGGPSNAPIHNLTLQLGSSRKAPAPSAQHMPAPALGMSGALPLLTPAVSKAEPDESALPPDMRVKGRILIFWGCGAQTRAGQPVVVDLAKMASGGQAALAASMKRLPYTTMKPPSVTRHATYGEWPNERTRVRVPAGGSLAGQHAVQGNYTPDIKFSLTASQDFLGPLTLQTRETPTGATAAWNALPGAKAYLATAVGGGERDTIAMWVSSEVQATAFSAPSYFSPSDITRLLEQKVLMAPQTTTCALPKAFVDAAPQAMVRVVAYGGEANFSHPPRPTDPKIPWNIEWTTKVRYRSEAAGVLGMDMSDMGDMGMDEDEEAGPPRRGQQRPAQGQQPPAGAARKAIMKGLGGMIGN
ncbi:hypothetical protein [Caulobacter sp. NIBR2454]|uniref:hypothetical protein n=1 Tax=Caulobacter sp. NIBR2454 TaxID=3015996 RepID=UPI0022B69F6B|nr:hypothetical protein [Caulobacter sp. NIBR2454]